MDKEYCKSCGKGWFYTGSFTILISVIISFLNLYGAFVLYTLSVLCFISSLMWYREWFLYEKEGDKPKGGKA
jgi:hypothetical protein